MHNPVVTAPIIGARTRDQLEDNLGALEVAFTEAQLAAQLAALDAVSAVELGFPHDFLALPMTREVMFGGVSVRDRVGLTVRVGGPSTEIDQSRIMIQRRSRS